MDIKSNMQVNTIIELLIENENGLVIDELCEKYFTRMFNEDNVPWEERYFNKESYESKKGESKRERINEKHKTARKNLFHSICGMIRGYNSKQNLFALSPKELDQYENILPITFYIQCNKKIYSDYIGEKIILSKPKTTGTPESWKGQEQCYYIRMPLRVLSEEYDEIEENDQKIRLADKLFIMNRYEKVEKTRKDDGKLHPKLEDGEVCSYMKVDCHFSRLAFRYRSNVLESEQQNLLLHRLLDYGHNSCQSLVGISDKICSLGSLDTTYGEFFKKYNLNYLAEKKLEEKQGRLSVGELAEEIVKNLNVIKTVDKLYECIASGYKIKFSLYSFSDNWKWAPINNKEPGTEYNILVSPYYTILDKGRIWLIAATDTHCSEDDYFTFYPVDLIDSSTIVKTNEMKEEIDRLPFFGNCANTIKELEGNFKDWHSINYRLTISYNRPERIRIRLITGRKEDNGWPVDAEGFYSVTTANTLIYNTFGYVETIMNEETGSFTFVSEDETYKYQVIEVFRSPYIVAVWAMENTRDVFVENESVQRIIIDHANSILKKYSK